MTQEDNSNADQDAIPDAIPDAMPPHMDTVSDAQLKKAGRSRMILIAAIIVGIAILVALGVLGYKVITDQQQAPSDIVAPTTLVNPDTSAGGHVDDTLTEPVAMAQLATLVGVQSDVVEDKLGANYQLVDIETVKDKKQPDVAQLMTYTNAGGNGSAASEALASTDTLYLTIDKAGIVIEVYDVISMDALGYPQTPFLTLLKDSSALSNVLRNVGITPIELNFSVPKIEDVTHYLGKKGDTDRKILKQEVSYEGKAQGSVADTWKVTFTYDYGVGVPADGSDQNTESRSLAVRITGKQ